MQQHASNNNSHCKHNRMERCKRQAACTAKGTSSLAQQHTSLKPESNTAAVSQQRLPILCTRFGADWGWSGWVTAEPACLLSRHSMQCWGHATSCDAPRRQPSAPTNTSHAVLPARPPCAHTDHQHEASTNHDTRCHREHQQQPKAKVGHTCICPR